MTVSRRRPRPTPVAAMTAADRGAQLSSSSAGSSRCPSPSDASRCEVAARRAKRTCRRRPAASRRRRRPTRDAVVEGDGERSSASCTSSPSIQTTSRRRRPAPTRRVGWIGRRHATARRRCSRRRALSSVSCPLAARRRVPGDAAAGAEVQPVVLDPERADGHVELALVAVGVDPPDGPAVDAARRPARAGRCGRAAASFGAPGDRAGRERGVDAARPTRPGAQPALDRADTRWHEPGVLPRRRAAPARVTDAELAHPTEVVAHEVDDHHVLGPVLGEEVARASPLVPLIGDDQTSGRRRARGTARATPTPPGRRVAGSSHHRANGAGLPIGEGGAERGDVGVARARGADSRRVRLTW